MYLKINYRERVVERREASRTLLQSIGTSKTTYGTGCFANMC